MQAEEECRGGDGGTADDEGAARDGLPVLRFGERLTVLVGVGEHVGWTDAQGKGDAAFVGCRPENAHTPGDADLWAAAV